MSSPGFCVSRTCAVLISVTEERATSRAGAFKGRYPSVDVLKERARPLLHYPLPFSTPPTDNSTRGSRSIAYATLNQANRFTSHVLSNVYPEIVQVYNKFNLVNSILQKNYHFITNERRRCRCEIFS